MRLTGSPSDLSRTGARGGFLLDFTSGSNFTLSIEARYMILSAWLSIINRTIRALRNKLRYLSSVSEERLISLLLL